MLNSPRPDSRPQVARFLAIVLVAVSLPVPIASAQLSWGSGGNGGAGTWNAANTNWWNGTTFSAPNPVWLPATYVGSSSGTWTFALPGAALTSTKVYKAVVRAQDRAGNIDTVTSTTTFIYDAVAPVSLATTPTGFNTSLPAIYGTASDAYPGALR